MMGKKKRQKYVPVDENYLSPIARAVHERERTKKNKKFYGGGKCNECGGELSPDIRFAERYCLKCGLVVR